MSFYFPVCCLVFARKAVNLTAFAFFTLLCILYTIVRSGFN